MKNYKRQTIWQRKSFLRPNHTSEKDLTKHCYNVLQARGENKLLSFTLDVSRAGYYFTHLNDSFLQFGHLVFGQKFKFVTFQLKWSEFEIKVINAGVTAFRLTENSYRPLVIGSNRDTILKFT